MRPTRARESRARYTTHMAGWFLLAECAVLPPAGDRVTWPSGRNGTQRAARAVLSREPRTRHQSETNRETGPTDRILSPRKRVWCFLPPSLSPILSLFLSLSIFLSFTLSSCTTILSSLPPFPSPCSSVALRARHITPWDHSRAPPRCLYHLTFPRPRANPPVLCVYTPSRAAVRAAVSRGIVGAIEYFCDTLT